MNSPEKQEYPGHVLNTAPGDCWCEPKIMVVLANDGKTPVHVIMHQKLSRPRLIPLDSTYLILDSVVNPPAEGWEAVMTRESVDKLVAGVLTLPIGLPMNVPHDLIQRKGESLDAFETRIQRFLIERGLICR